MALVRITPAPHRVMQPERTRQGYGHGAFRDNGQGTFCDNRYHPARDGRHPGGGREQALRADRSAAAGRSRTGAGRGGHRARPERLRQDDAAARSWPGSSDRPRARSRSTARRPQRARAAKRIGFVPQSPALLPWRTVEANVRLLQEVNRGGNPHDLPDVDVAAARRRPRRLPRRPPPRAVGRHAAARRPRPGVRARRPVPAHGRAVRGARRDHPRRHAAPAGAAVRAAQHGGAVRHPLAGRGRLPVRPRRRAVGAARASVVGVERIDLPHPRTPDLEDDPEFFAAETRLRHLLHQGAGR